MRLWWRRCRRLRPNCGQAHIVFGGPALPPLVDLASAPSTVIYGEEEDYGAFCQALLYVVPGVWTFTLVRMAQVFFIAAILPMTISVFARSAGGGEIGFLNSARFAGNALGPLMATSILAYSNLLVLYLGIAGMTVAMFFNFLRVVNPQNGPLGVPRDGRKSERESASRLR